MKRGDVQDNANDETPQPELSPRRRSPVSLGTTLHHPETPSRPFSQLGCSLLGLFDISFVCAGESMYGSGD